MLIGDVTYGGMQRAYLEKVNGEYQGAVFRLTQGLEAGVSELSLGPDGAHLRRRPRRGGGNWGQDGQAHLRPAEAHARTAPARSTSWRCGRSPSGFELEYTQPLSAATAARAGRAYRSSSGATCPTAAYGGPKVDEQTLTVTSATLSADRQKVTLDLAGLQAGRVVHVRSPRPFTSTTGQSLWSTEAWYTLNAIPGGTSQRPGARRPSTPGSAAARPW